MPQERFLTGEERFAPSELEQARIDFERTQDEYRRMKFLYDHQSLAANDFQKIEAAYLASKQRYDMARKALALKKRTPPRDRHMPQMPS